MESGEQVREPENVVGAKRVGSENVSFQPAADAPGPRIVDRGFAPAFDARHLDGKIRAHSVQPPVLALDQVRGLAVTRHADGVGGRCRLARPRTRVVDRCQAPVGVVPSIGEVDEPTVGEIGVLALEELAHEGLIDLDFGARRRHGILLRFDGSSARQRLIEVLRETREHGPPAATLVTDSRLISTHDRRSSSNFAGALP